MLKFACSLVLISTVQPYRFRKTNKFKYSLNTFPFRHTTTSINDGNGAERKHSFENWAYVFQVENIVEAVHNAGKQLYIFQIS